MGKRITAVLDMVTPSTGYHIAITPLEARERIYTACFIKGFSRANIDGAFDIFSRAAAHPGLIIAVHTGSTVGIPNTAAAERVHTCMDAITSDPVAADLMARVFDTAPGTHFEHSLRKDLCGVALVVTNAPLTVRP